MKRYALALDLQDDKRLIAEYEQLHQAVAPEIQQSIKDSGITRMDIYRFGNRMFMIIDANDDFSFDEKATADAENPLVQEWEQLTWKYQKAIPGSKPGEKWVIMNKIFELSGTERNDG
ncbi:L-rhamnose mutarotase [Parapedobacter indicus]|uniref:L-rhamnose mutarotase n=1 Tax=Parapedobacter indicus TaxID=1477437 RepID=A0A1I3DCW1_9SPHI|nr:L-rhamnose mutarotase [Parapedobacter indicus]PPL04621.1 L-rhamnose mutarotase [Parapedobacter indicus]SFH84564.1 L-rhamnose mutarotase [Parapedobacter indicus]